jgi:DNA polymerase III epsilon subunit-like protein
MAYGTGKPQEPNSFIAFDFETGGLESQVNPATEIALIAIKGDETLDEIGRYQGLIKPYDSALIYTEKAAATSGISLELLEDEGLDLNEVVDGVVDLMRSANFSPKNSAGIRSILVGHNPMFDINFLNHIFERRFDGVKGTSGQLMLESLVHGRRDHFGNFQPSYLNTWSLGKMWFGAEAELRDFKLGTIVERAGVELSDAHRAMNDTIATADFLRTFIRNLRSGFGANEEYIGSTHNKRQNFHFPI